MFRKEKIAIVILNWNGVKLFNTFLPSVIQNSVAENIEIIVADNGSTDNSIIFLSENFPEIRIIDLIENFGFAEGYNRALKQVEADYFVLINSDVKVSPNWIEPCVKRLREDEKIAAVQPKILSFNQPELFEYAGAAGGFIDKFGYPFCRGRLLNKLEHDNGQYNDASPIFWASGACIFIKAKTFKKANGFDGDFWAHMEEIDLCWRLKNKGLDIWYEPQSVVYHLGGGTLSYGSPQKVYLNFRNNLWMLFKNLPPHKFKRIFFARLVLDGIAALKFIFGFHFRSFWAVVKAHGAFYKNLSSLIRKRKEIQTLTVVKEHPEIYSKSIMWKFFVQNKNKFSELNFNPNK
ncbi:MAG: glycosyltransferase family 2 protein [Prolixibacteraceae bacterium]|jgi:GT2 family glycosyltransferase|nr:glycosyltransferase family 2 protein [Prolixibacteraceae bacterium]MBT6765726.1 glycosyltransferase family 2 protein [Prolixibacteraceae bacterium]MBT6998201.1 glycosyltransferase family 2 protein [Prolixibacteraceae bacterium]MBT7393230.1 glycosyltransferase family 2 protein [Prolixibacteraceae bacterium]